MRTVTAYVAPSEGAPLVKSTIARRDLGPRDVLIELKYAGICHSDIHTVRGDWGPQAYPLTVGHEMVGVVVETGPDVTKHRVGDQVGVGTMVNSCGRCEYCVAGLEQYCAEGNVQAYGSLDRDGTITQGGYSTHVVVVEDFVLRVPEGVPFEGAAPLLCAGITTFSPLRRWGAGPGVRVGVVGMGGLGHMAVQFAHALGADVTVLSQTLSKHDDGLRLGADRYCATNDPETFTKLAESLDIVINTVSASIDVDAFLGLLAVDGVMVNVGAPPKPMSFRALNLLVKRRSLAGSATGGIRQTQEMLEFCAQRGIGSEVEVIAADQVNDAYERVLASDVRYRFVIDLDTLR